jgi:uncharacterized RDD family membrane protein YckC
MYCTRCGNPLTEGAAFCRRCGQAVPAVATSTPQEGLESIASYTPPAQTIPVEASLPPLPAPPVAWTAPLPYAGFWLRLVAYLIDSAIVDCAFGALVALAMGVVGWDRIRGIQPGLEVKVGHFGYLSVMVQKEFDYRGQLNFLAPGILGGILLVLLVTVIVTWLYHALMESSAKQGTLGKMALGLIVTNMSGERISFGRASGRFFCKFITSLIPFCVGYFMAGFSEKKQALHDVLASCLVLRKA